MANPSKISPVWHERGDFEHISVSVKKNIARSRDGIQNLEIRKSMRLGGMEVGVGGVSDVRKKRIDLCVRKKTSYA